MRENKYITMDETPDGNYITDGKHVFRVLKVGEGKIMSCYEIVSGQNPNYKRGETTIAYFKTKFIHLRIKEIADKVIAALKDKK